MPAADKTLRVHSIFSSLQGEGRFAGYPTAFLRLAGCDLRCAWCDAAEAAEGTIFSSLFITAIAERLLAARCLDLCITGGEPLLQREELAALLCHVPEFRVVLETNGRHPVGHLISEFPTLFASVDWKTPSSGNTFFDETNLSVLGERGWVKFVVATEEDLTFVREKAPRVAGHGIEIFVSPVFETGSPWLRRVADFVAAENERIPMRFQLQIHKVLDIP